jgi:hypothetical protein
MTWARCVTSIPVLRELTVFQGTWGSPCAIGASGAGKITKNGKGSTGNASEEASQQTDVAEVNHMPEGDWADRVEELAGDGLGNDR